MEKLITSKNKPYSFLIVLLYAAISACYIYASDYILVFLVKDINLLSKIQTYKGLAFIFITSLLLYFLVKRNIRIISTYYEKIIETKKIIDSQTIGHQEEYTLLFNHSPFPIWIIDLETLGFIDVNEAACVNYGYSKEEYLTMTLHQIRPAEEAGLVESIIANIPNSSNYSFPFYIKHLKKNGELIDVKIKSSLMTFRGKQVRLASGVNVTSEIATQNKLEESNSKLKLASEIAGLGYWSKEFGYSEIQWSDEIYKIYDVDPNLTKISLDFIKAHYHPDDLVYFQPNFFNDFENAAIKESEHRIITDSGKIKWILERQYLVKENNKAVKLNGIMIDITKRKLYEQELIDSNERFKILTTTTIEAVVDWDIINNKVMWGEGFQTMMGYDISASNNGLWANNIHPDDKEEVLAELNKTLADPTKYNFNAEFRFLKANGSIARVQHKGVFVRDANGKATRALGTMIDLTDNLERMRKIELQNEALKQIAWTQSHIVRAPLANLLGLTDLLLDNVDSGITDAVLVGHIKDSAEKLDKIIHDIVSKTK